MTEYDNTNRGSIWKNDKKEKDTHPDFTGSLNVDGREFWVSAWKRKEGASPKAPALSFSVKPKDEPHERRPVEDVRGGSKPRDMDDEIPFNLEWR
jgi:hypothetical protein